MKKWMALLLAVVSVGYTQMALGQGATIVSSPSGAQTITQPSGTNFSVNTLNLTGGLSFNSVPFWMSIQPSATTLNFNNSPVFYANASNASTAFGNGLSTFPGAYNSAFGTNALVSNTTGTSNDAFGVGALGSNTTGFWNVGIGGNSLGENTSGAYNVGIGEYSLAALANGNHDSALGFAALGSLVQGNDDVGLGMQAGQFTANDQALNQNSYASIFIGFNTQAAANGDSNEVVIGDLAIGNGSNTVTLGNQWVATTVLQGNVGIGTSSPGQKLQIGNAIPSGTATDGLIRLGSMDGVGNYRFWDVGTSQTTAPFDFYIWDKGLGAPSVPSLTAVYGSGYVGIGTTTPHSQLEVNGSITMSAGSTGVLTFPDGSIQTKAAQGVANLASNNGQIGIGTTSPQANLDVTGSPATDVLGTEDELHLTRLLNSGVAFPQVAALRLGTYNTTNACCGPQSRLDVNLKAAATGTLTAETNVMTLLANGNVGVGTNAPGADLAGIANAPAPNTPVLEVGGDIAILQKSGAGIIFQDGTIQTTAYVGTTCPTGGDYAESVDVTGDKNTYEPGDVMVVDPSRPGHFLKSSTPYSTLVSGIYSTKPGFVGRRQTSDPRTATSEIPMAMVGIVPTKVSDENGPIKAGDLLVTSSTPGYAMKGKEKDRMIGAIVGKALSGLEFGTGVVETLVSLQ